MAFIFFILLFSGGSLLAQKPLINDASHDWVMTFEDNFDGTELDWDTWSSDDSKYLKNETYRDKYCVEVRGGELLLHVKKESFKNSVWRAASLFMNEPLENNSYVECRFKSTQCSGVNNAFWLANKTSPYDVYKNRYEIDIVEARYNVKTEKGAGHVAWHDWKTFSYTKNEEGKKFDIAQGTSINHDFSEYHTWGLWYGENEIAIYLDGIEVWNGKTHPKFIDQWWSGVGKAKTWNPIEEKRAYGKFEQDDWSYQAGYNGDKLNVMLSTLPWGEAFTPLTDEADGTFMAIDYVRIFKPSHLLNQKPAELIQQVSKSVLLKNDYSLAKDTCIYFSVVAEKLSNQSLDLRFVEANGREIFTVGIDVSNNLSISINERKSSTAVSYPASESRKQMFEARKKYLLVGRITARKGKEKYDRDAISFSVFDMNELPVKKEPYLYPNIDAFGNTSMTNEWQINAKDYSDAVLKSVQIRGNWKLNDFKVGYNYLSILPEKWYGAIAQLKGCEMMKSGAKTSFEVPLEGKLPFSLIYSINGEEKTVSGIKSNRYPIELQPKENTTVALIDVLDADNNKGTVLGQAFAVMANKKQLELSPIFDTYTQKGKELDFSNYQYFEMKGERAYEREIFMSFDLAEGVPSTGDALFFIYCSDNQKKEPLVMDVFSVDIDQSPLIAHTLNLTGESFTRLGSIEMGGETDKYVGCSLGNIVAKYLSEGRRYLILKLKYSQGNEFNMVKFLQGHGQTSTKGPKLVFVNK